MASYYKYRLWIGVYGQDKQIYVRAEMRVLCSNDLKDLKDRAANKKNEKQRALEEGFIIFG